MIEFVLTELNPHPWTVGGRGRTGAHFKSGQLEAYQEALKEEIKISLPSEEFLPEPPYKVEFLFWRELEEGVSGYSKRATRGHECDATNLQKATEDALQGVLFTNDRLVRDIRSVIVAQGPEVQSKIMIRIDHFTGEIS